MPKRPWLTESDKPSYQVVKWIGGGGFGQVFKVVRDGQVQAENVEAALDEYDHMKALRGAPHIAALHDGLEYNRKTSTLSFFMDYYRGKDLDRQVQMLRGAAEHFTESQIVEIGYQIAVALEFCHSKNILHQDMKPMNVLLREPWNPMTQRDVPDLYVADFGIASHVQTMATRITGQRSTPGYEAPEIRGQGYQAAFSQKSDIYAFGCILYRLCSLEEPGLLDNFNPSEMSMNYSVELLKLIRTMLSSERDERPTAVQVKDGLKTIALQLFQPKTTKCHTCDETFPSRNQLTKHLKQTGHYRSAAGTDASVLPAPNASGKTSKFNIRGYAETPGQPGKENELRIRGCADAPVQYHYDEKNLDAVDPSPCAVCKRHFKTKKQFFTHLLGGPRHFRGAKYVQKRKAERGLDSDVEKEDERLAKWARKDMERHN